MRLSDEGSACTSVLALTPKLGPLAYIVPTVAEGLRSADDWAGHPSAADRGCERETTKAILDPEATDSPTLWVYVRGEELLGDVQMRGIAPGRI